MKITDEEKMVVYEDSFHPLPFVRDYIVWSIINFIFLGWAGWQVSGVALIFSFITRDGIKEGNTEKARRYSKLALIFNILSVIKAFVFVPIAIIWKIKYSV